MRKEKLEWKRMVEGKLYNATSKDIFGNTQGACGSRKTQQVLRSQSTSTKTTSQQAHSIFKGQIRVGFYAFLLRIRREY